MMGGVVLLTFYLINYTEYPLISETSVSSNRCFKKLFGGKFNKQSVQYYKEFCRMIGINFSYDA